MASNSTQARMSPRRRCPRPIQYALMVSQGWVCVYCALPFGSVISRRGKLISTQVHWDHFVPVAYASHSAPGNYVAACNICNHIKAANMFTSLAEARSWVLDQWPKRRIEVEWVAPVASEHDPQRWAVAFATYLASRPRGLTSEVSWVMPKGVRQ